MSSSPVLFDAEVAMLSSLPPHSSPLESQVESERSAAGCGLTVAIPTYNGADRLPQVLEHLRAQVVPAGWRWEVLVVDNHSQDATPQVVRQAQETWRADVPLRYVCEARPGAAFARKRAIDLAHHEWVAFLDDDNWPDPHWVASAIAFGDDRPEVGAFGGRILGHYRQPVPPNFRRIQAYLAIVDRGGESFCYDPRTGLLPPAAGLVVRRQAWLDCVRGDPLLSGRTGGRTAQTMLTSEDLEAMVYVQRAGWQIAYNPGMSLQHAIEPHRLQREYLLPFMRGIGSSRYVVRMLRLAPWQRPIATLIYWLNDLRRSLLHGWRYRDRLGKDLVVDAERSLYAGYLAGPYELRHLLRTPPRQVAAKKNAENFP